MSNENSAKNEKEKKPKRLGKIIFGVAIIILVGGAAGGGYFIADILGPQKEKAEEADKPKLVSKDGSPIESSTMKSATKSSLPAGLGSGLKATYYPLAEPFTSNLKDSESFAQMSLAIATYYDERVLANIQEHETAIRSAVLMTLAEQDSEVLSTAKGKEILQKLLTMAINKTLTEKSGFGGVDNVYFTSFVVQ